MGHIVLPVGLTAFVLSMTARELLLRTLGALPQALDAGLIFLDGLRSGGH